MAGTIEYPLSNGGFALIDDDDYEKVSSFGKWYKNDGGYAVKKTRIHGKNISIRMHSLINDTPKGWHTDHINGDRLDNRKYNLRTVSAEMNAWNRHSVKIHRVYDDLPAHVSFDKSRSQFVATRTLRRRFTNRQDAIKFVKQGVDEL